MSGPIQDHGGLRVWGVMHITHPATGLVPYMSLPVIPVTHI
jgi:hypothetical protein